jgi:hypothetical protein
MRTITNPLRLGEIQRYYVRGGSPVCDVSTSEGAYFKAVPLRCYGQGTLFPVKAGDKVHLYFPDGRVDLPYIVGVDYAGSLPESSADPSTTSDYSASLEDAVLTHEESTVSLSQYGITLEPSGSVRIQLRSGQVFRVSVEGNSTDRALRGQAFIDAIFPLLEDYNNRLQAIEQWARALNVQGAPPSVPFTPPIAPINPSTTQGDCEGTKSTAVVIQ